MALGNLIVNLVADSTAFNRALKRADRTIQGFARKIEGVGRSISASISAPLAAVGGIAAKMGASYGNTMKQIEALTGAAAADVEAWSRQLLQLAPQLGKGPRELAQGLLFAASAGLKGRDAIEALTAAAKGSAIGMGEMRDVVNAISFAVNAYGSDVLNASSAMDVLTQAVKEGQAEASEIAPALGAVIPIASAVGVKFHEVAAGIAAMTRTGASASEAAVRLRAILNAFVSPTVELQAGLAKIGLTAAKMLEIIRAKGLLAALEELRDRLAANGLQLSDVFGRVEALVGAMQLVTSNVQANRDVFDSLSKSAGATDKAFQAFVDDTLVRARGTLASVQAALIELSKDAFPLINDILGKSTALLVRLTESWRALPPDIRESILVVGAFVVAIGPLLIILGKLLGLLGTVGGALIALGARFPAIIAWFGTAGVAIAGFIARNIHPLIAVLSLLLIAFKTNFVGIADAWDWLWMRIKSVGNKILNFVARVAKAVAGLIAMAGGSVGGTVTQGPLRNPLDDDPTLTRGAGAAPSVSAAATGPEILRGEAIDRTGARGGGGVSPRDILGTGAAAGAAAGSAAAQTFGIEVLRGGGGHGAPGAFAETVLAHPERRVTVPAVTSPLTGGNLPTAFDVFPRSALQDPALHRRLAGLAEGGRVLSRGLAMVGERGPEVVDLPRGARVAPLAGGVGEQTIIIQMDSREVARAAIRGMPRVAHVSAGMRGSV